MKNIGLAFIGVSSGFTVAAALFALIATIGVLSRLAQVLSLIHIYSQGRKMSKSLGNGIDPLEVIDKYGADALRFTLVTGNAPGNDMRFYWERVEASRNFANKVWNASRFMLMNFEQAEEAGISIDNVTLDDLTQADKWLSLIHI